MSPKKDEKTVHCCDPALSVLVMFGVLKRFSCIYVRSAVCLGGVLDLGSRVDRIQIQFYFCTCSRTFDQGERVIYTLPSSIEF